eukprot:scaffold2118_cov391-Prasinococcus_capsulatus_cf.AAC.4
MFSVHNSPNGSVCRLLTEGCGPPLAYHGMEEAQGRLLGQYAYRLDARHLAVCRCKVVLCPRDGVTGSGSRWARHAISHRQLGAWDYTEEEMHVRAAVATLPRAAARAATVRSRADLGAGGHARPTLYPPPEAPRVLLGAAILRR